MKTLLIFVNTYLPGYKAGGPIQSISNLCSFLRPYYRIYLICNCHDYGDPTNYPQLNYDEFLDFKGIHVMYVSRGIWPYLCSLRKARDLNPDFIYCNSFYDFKFSIFPALMHLFGYLIAKYRFVIAPRGELTTHSLAIKCFKKKLLNTLYLPLLKTRQQSFCFHSTSRYETEQIFSCVESCLSLDIYEAPNIPVQPCPHSLLKSRPVSSDRLNIIFLSRITPKKNLLYALQVLHNVSSRCTFHVIGPIQDFSYWTECLLAASTLPRNIDFQYLGDLPHSNIQRALMSYDLLFFPTLGENYGHVIYESLSVGCPVLISDSTPWSNTVLNGCLLYTSA
mgnify:CR=1 FL=1